MCKSCVTYLLTYLLLSGVLSDDRRIFATNFEAPIATVIQPLVANDNS